MTTSPPSRGRRRRILEGALGRALSLLLRALWFLVLVLFVLFVVLVLVPKGGEHATRTGRDNNENSGAISLAASTNGALFSVAPTQKKTKGQGSARPAISRASRLETMTTNKKARRSSMAGPTRGHRPKQKIAHTPLVVASFHMAQPRKQQKKEREKKDCRNVGYERALPASCTRARPLSDRDRDRNRNCDRKRVATTTTTSRQFGFQSC
jgi:hypothetical protein